MHTIEDGRSGGYTDGIVSPKFSGPFVDRAEVGAVAPEMLRDIPGKPAPSQGLQGPLTGPHPLTLPKSRHPAPVHALAAGGQGSIMRSERSGSGAGNLLYTNPILVKA